MSIWDGFRKGVGNNLDEGKQIVKDGLVNVGNRVADLIGLPEEPEGDDPKPDTFDWVLYAAGGVTLVALVLVVIFKFRRANV